jgi:uncharacterized protein (DUF1810 family)
VKRSESFGPSVDLSRFTIAQDGGASHDRSGTAYEVALKEIRNGAKVGHWMWFIFPQGPFGESEMSQRYAIKNRDESLAYLQHEILRSRLHKIATATAEQLERGADPNVLMGGEIDCMKLVSSMTLFQQAAEESNDLEVGAITERVLALLASHGWPICSKTIDWLTQNRPG